MNEDSPEPLLHNPYVIRIPPSLEGWGPSRTIQALLGLGWALLLLLLFFWWQVQKLPWALTVDMLLSPRLFRTSGYGALLALFVVGIMSAMLLVDWLEKRLNPVIVPTGPVTLRWTDTTLTIDYTLNRWGYWGGSPQVQHFETTWNNINDLYLVPCRSVGYSGSPPPESLYRLSLRWGNGAITYDRPRENITTDIYLILERSQATELQEGLAQLRSAGIRHCAAESRRLRDEWNNR